MAKKNQDSADNYLPVLWDQIQFLNETTFFIWICGIAFTKVSAGVWLGDRPVVVLLTILSLVYLYMHFGRYHAMLVRFPFLLLILYLGHTHLIQPGNFFLAGPFLLSWKHLVLVWIAMNFSFLLFAKEHYVPIRLITKANSRQFDRTHEIERSGNVISIQKTRAV